MICYYYSIVLWIFYSFCYIVSYNLAESFRWSISRQGGHVFALTAHRNACLAIKIGSPLMRAAAYLLACRDCNFSVNVSRKVGFAGLGDYAYAVIASRKLCGNYGIHNVASASAVGCHAG